MSIFKKKIKKTKLLYFLPISKLKVGSVMDPNELGQIGAKIKMEKKKLKLNFGG